MSEHMVVKGSSLTLAKREAVLNAARSGTSAAHGFELTFVGRELEAKSIARENG